MIMPRAGRLLVIITFSMLLLGEIFFQEATAALPRTGQRSCYDTEGVAIDYQGTGQDGELQTGDVWPDPRFIDNGDGTVTDRLTNLMWLQDGNCLGRMTWQGAMVAASGAGEVGQCRGLTAYSDWTLPDINELELLFNAEESSANSWLNRHRFRNVQPGGYWSATVGPNPYDGWIFRFDTGEVKQTGKVELQHVLLVRSQENGEAAPAPPAESIPAKRFVDNGDGTITDTVTELMWLKDASCLGSASWQEALQAIKLFNNESVSAQCRGLTAGYHDWALPNRHELRSLVDHDEDLPAFPRNHPFKRLQSYYWSSTTAASQTQHAYDIYFGDGSLHVADKDEVFGVWPVRPAAGRLARQRMTEKLLAEVEQKDPYLLQPLDGPMGIDWPVKRFTDLGDGTVIDNITGLMWLKDAKCFEVESWKNAFVVVGWLNTIPERLKCIDYTARYQDWQLPDRVMLQELAQGAEGEPAQWLNSQGVTRVQARDYWSREKNYLNLYYAWGVNMRQGTPRNYPASFELNVWPFRWPFLSVAVTPKPILRVDDRAENVTLKLGKELVLSAAIDNVSGVVPAVFSIWYEAPDSSQRWLSQVGEWQPEKTDVFSGNIFHLENSPVFKGDTAEMAAGTYNFYFSLRLDVQENEPQALFTSQIRVILVEETEQVIPAVVISEDDMQVDGVGIEERPLLTP